MTPADHHATHAAGATRDIGTSPDPAGTTTTAGHGSASSLASVQVRHDTFVETRHLDADPSAVYRAFADPALLRRWFKLPGSDATYQHDFRVGGGENALSTFRHLDGTEEHLEYRSRYLHLDPNRRIVYGYESLVQNILRWTSLVTVELDPDQNGTRLTWTEQAAFVAATGDGSADLPHLRGAIRLRLNGLPTALAPA
jgi:uncharacterized protein YndB with AHSA1/START domain